MFPFDCAAWVFALKGFMLPKRHPKMSEPTPLPRQCPSTTQVEHPSFCLNLPWSFPKDQALYLFASKNWSHQRWYTSGIDLRIIHSSLWGSRVASVAQFLYCIWVFFVISHEKLEGVGVHMVFHGEEVSSNPSKCQKSPWALDTIIGLYASLITFFHLGTVDPFLLLFYCNFAEHLQEKPKLSYISIFFQT